MGEDAQGEAIVTVEYNGRGYRGTSVTTDIVESGVRAFLEVSTASRRRARPRPDCGGAPRLRDCADVTPQTARDDRHDTVRRRSGTVTSSCRRRADTPAVLYIDLHLTARGHVAAGVRPAAAARTARAPPGSHARDDGSLDADRYRADVRRRADRRRFGRAPGAPARSELRASSASSCWISSDQRRGIVHIIGPGVRDHAARQDDRLRRQSHEHARRVRRARVRHRHDRSRATCSRRNACCSAARRRSAIEFDRSARRRCHGEGPGAGDHRRASASTAAPAT